MAIYSESTTQKAGAANAKAAAFNGGELQFWTGVVPADPALTPVGTLLATHTLGNPAWTTSTDGTMTLNTTTPLAAIAAGDIGFARFVSSSGAGLAAGDAGLAGASITIDTLAVLIGDVITITTPIWHSEL